MRLSAIALAMVLVGCTDEPNVEFSMDDDTSLDDARVNYDTGDQFATLTENGAIKLGLTSERVYFEASAALRRHIDREIAEGMSESDSRIARSIGNAVRRGVQSALNVDIAFRLEEIESVDYRDGELVFTFVDADDRRRIENIDIDDKPITRSFAEADARAFVDAFARVKAGETIRRDTVIDVRKGTLADTSRKDSSGGSF